MKSTYSYRSSCKTRLRSEIASKRLLRQWPPRLLRLQILNKLLGVLWLGPSGPIALGHPMTIGIQDADLILPQALLMNMREVPSIDLLQFIAKQVPCRLGLYLSHEANIKTL